MKTKTKNVCTVCGKTFVTKNAKRKWCTKACKQIISERHAMKNGQLCWECQRATGGCSWSRSFEPVPGWKAKETKIKNSQSEIVSSYRIYECPQFIFGRGGI